MNVWLATKIDLNNIPVCVTAIIS